MEPIALGLLGPDVRRSGPRLAGRQSRAAGNPTAPADDNRPAGDIPVSGRLQTHAPGWLYAAIQYPSGRLSDDLSRKTVLVISIGIIVGGFVVLMTFSTYAGYLFGMALVGVGVGSYYPVMRAQLSDLFTELRGQAFGLNSAAGVGGSARAAGLAVGALTLATW